MPDRRSRFTAGFERFAGRLSSASRTGRSTRRREDHAVDREDPPRLRRPVDVSDTAAAQQAVDRAVEAAGRIDVALLNVGTGPSFKLARAGAADILANMDANYRGDRQHARPTDRTDEAAAGSPG
jgi:NAD(P)-dependent dehydrogenase (short-subunit alcohol dehydrogenase family)